VRELFLNRRPQLKARGAYTIEFEPVGPIEVWESHDTGVVVIPQELARVSLGAARRAVGEYVATGQRPTCVMWDET
jgi:hypothetical protein